MNPVVPRVPRGPFHRGLCAASLAALFCSAARAQEVPPGDSSGFEDLTELSLEDLMQVEVTSASRRSQPLEEVPAAIFVLTHEDLRRSGATSIPEALRLVPGMSVARLDSNRWAVSARGFNDQFANKMLVLIDGRSVYTPLFSGVLWDEVDVPFEDIERIEIIRGPGAAMWGSNAVNGVISIITRESSKTQGGLVSLGAGNVDRALTYARYGGELGDGHWRVWGKYFDRDASELGSGADAQDDWHVGRGGFRIDLPTSEDDHWLLEGDVYDGDVHNMLTYPSPSPPFQIAQRNESRIDGWSLLGRWTHRISEASELQAMAYIDGNSRDIGIFSEDRTTQGIDLQHRVHAGEDHEVVWGMSYRSTHAGTEGSPTLSFGDENRTDNLFAAFVQDEIELVDERWFLTLGAKVENNDYSGWEFQPNARLWFRPSPHQAWWASVSRAVRTPSQVEDDVSLLAGFIPGAPNQVPTLFGNGDLDSEKLTAYELGYRVQPSEKVSLDIATFYNDYQDLIVFEQGAPFFSGGDLIIPLIAENATQGTSYGAELSAAWQWREDTRLIAGYSFIQLEVDDTATGPSTQGDEVPENQVQLRIEHDLNERTDIDLTCMYVDRLESGDIDDYFRTDARVEWRPSVNLRLVLGAQSLFHQGSEEFRSSQLGPSSESRTAGYFKVTWSF